MRSPQEEDAVVDYWREIVRRGVAAVGFTCRRFGGETWMVAELVAPQRGMVQRATQAVLEIDKALALETGSQAWSLRRALADHLETGAAADDLAAYQEVLAERLYSEIQDDPAAALARLAAPHEAVTLYGRS